MVFFYEFIFSIAFFILGVSPINFFKYRVFSRRAVRVFFMNIGGFILRVRGPIVMAIGLIFFVFLLELDSMVYREFAFG